MVSEEAGREILEYLKEKGPTNTFHLAYELKIDRYKLLNLIRRLENQAALEFKSGVVRFLKFPAEEKVVKPKPAGVRKIRIKKAKVEPGMLADLKAENLKLKERLLTLEKDVRGLEQKATTPRVIRKVIRKTIIKEVPALAKEKKSERKSRKKRLFGKKVRKEISKKLKAIREIRFPKFTLKKIIKRLEKGFAKKRMCR